MPDATQSDNHDHGATRDAHGFADEALRRAAMRRRVEVQRRETRMGIGVEPHRGYAFFGQARPGKLGRPQGGP